MPPYRTIPSPEEPIFAGVLFFNKDKQKLSTNSKNLRIFKLTFRNIYKFLRINWERFLFNNDFTMVTAIW